MTRSRSDHVLVSTNNVTPLPLQILENHRSVILRTDALKVNELPFLVTYGRVVNDGTSNKMLNIKVLAMIKAITMVLRTYGTRDSESSLLIPITALHHFCRIKNSWS